MPIGLCTLLRHGFVVSCIGIKRGFFVARFDGMGSSKASAGGTGIKRFHALFVLTNCQGEPLAERRKNGDANRTINQGRAQGAETRRNLVRITAQLRPLYRLRHILAHEHRHRTPQTHLHNPKPQLFRGHQQGLFRERIAQKRRKKSHEIVGTYPTLFH